MLAGTQERERLHSVEPMQDRRSRARLAATWFLCNGDPQAEVPEEIVEKGDIYFAYRPRIEEDKAEGLADVQRFYMVMKPEGQVRLRVAV
ncbi:hypothetical protein JIR23_02400 [Bradyrhizobium diazoefficiens]|nr:hypothetical protein [Bradyrhizobium diazoefficiens]QQN64694.1 hypothetical protein JIR23_02400 [Bradyrhizobium diazoefficiens]